MTWSYTRQVKGELVATPLGPLPCCWAELWGISGYMNDPQEIGLPWVHCGAAFVIRRGFRLMKALQLDPSVRLERRLRRLEFSLWGQDVPPPDLDQSLADCPAALVRGAFLLRGYVSEADRPVHWEISTANGEWAEVLSCAMSRVGVDPHHSRRRGQVVLYLKERDEVAYILGQMGAHQSVLALQSESVVRELKNQVNRLVNSETANMKRVVDSALRDRAGLYELKDRLGTIPVELRQLADVRMKHPDWSFEEVGRHFNPPLSKSQVNHRLRRLRRWMQNELENR